MRFKALTHPSPDDMAEYLRGGEAAAYPKISRIQNGLLLERTLEACVRSLSAQLKREQRHRNRRQQRQQQQGHADMHATHAHVDRPVQAQSAHSVPTASQPSQSAPSTPHRLRKGSGDSPSVPPQHRSHRKSSGDGASSGLSDALQRAAAGGRHLHSSSHPHHGPGGPSLLTPTAAVLAQLPLHGAGDATDTDGDATDSAAESARSRLLRAASRAHHGQPRVEEETEASGPLSDSDVDSLFHSDSLADLSDHSTGTVASFIDWDAEEDANHELERTAGDGAHGHALRRYQAEANRHAHSEEQVEMGNNSAGAATSNNVAKSQDDGRPSS